MRKSSASRQQSMSKQRNHNYEERRDAGGRSSFDFKNKGVLGETKKLHDKDTIPLFSFNGAEAKGHRKTGARNGNNG